MTNVATDPVCGMSLDRNGAAATSDYRGETYFFCSKDCKTKFERNPDDYARESRAGE